MHVRVAAGLRRIKRCALRGLWPVGRGSSGVTLHSARWPATHAACEEPRTPPKRCPQSPEPEGNADP
jgi:hypothetical protein